MIERLEGMVSRLLEGRVARLFRTPLQPVQLGKRVIRAMESHRTVSLSKTFVPNSYVVSLAPSDFAQFEQYRRSLERDLAEAVLGAARDRGLTLLAYPTVELERDDDIPSGDVRVSCALVDETGGEVGPEAPAIRATASGHTMVLDRDALLRDRPRSPKASIEVRDAERRRVGLGPDPLAIGRDPENDIVLSDRRVSRRHAEIKLRLGRYTLYDLQSTNGTLVNGRRVAEVVLSDGDRIAIGGTEMVFSAE